MQESFTMAPGRDYAVFDPLQARHIGYFRDSQYYEAGRGPARGCLLDGRFHLDNCLVGELRGSQIMIAGNPPYALQLQQIE